MTLSRRLLLALLAGFLVTLGGVVAPTLFATLNDRALAGEIAGRFFHIANLVTVASSLLLWWPLGATPNSSRGLAPLPGVSLGLSEWVLHPMIVAEKAAHGSTTPAFALLHGVSSALYAVATIAVLTLLWRELRRPAVVNPAG
jgi:hypothetical protein